MNRVLFASLFSVAALVPVIAEAQTVSVGALGLKADHKLLGNRLTGGTIQFASTLGQRHLAVRLSAERMRGSAERIGVPCGGLIQPGTCAPEPVADMARLAGGGIGVAFQQLVRERFDVSVTADWMVAGLHVDTRGLASGRTVSASKMMWGPQLGMDAQWMPVKGVPLALEIGGAIRGFVPVVHDNITDGYTPFEDSFGGALARVGVSWRFGS